MIRCRLCCHQLLALILRQLQKFSTSNVNLSQLAMLTDSPTSQMYPIESFFYSHACLLLAMYDLAT